MYSMIKRVCVYPCVHECVCVTLPDAASGRLKVMLRPASVSAMWH